MDDKTKKYLEIMGKMMPLKIVKERKNEMRERAEEWAEYKKLPQAKREKIKKLIDAGAFGDKTEKYIDEKAIKEAEIYWEQKIEKAKREGILSLPDRRSVELFKRMKKRIKK